MPTNVEIKAVLRDREAVEAIARRLSDGPPLRVKQDDTFFNCSKGRLKLRKENGDQAELIYYERADNASCKPSFYQIVQVTDPDGLKRALIKAYGEKARVVKERTLYRIKETRIHLDRVEGLGDYMELEVVLKGGMSHDAGADRARFLMGSLGIREEDLVCGAYADLLIKKKG